MDVNYLAEIIAFERWLETNYLPISSQLLWYKMMNLCNRSGWSEWVTVDNLRLMAAMQMGREATLIKARDELIKAGRIVYQKGKKGSPNRYRMIYFTCKNAVKSEVQRVVKSEVYQAVKSEVQSADIYKQNDKQNIKKDNKEKPYFENEELEKTFCDFMKMRKSLKNGAMTDRAIMMMVKKLSAIDSSMAVKMLEQSILNNWKDVYPLKDSREKAKSNNQFQQFPQREVDYDALVMQGLQDMGDDEHGKEI